MRGILFCMGGWLRGFADRHPCFAAAMVAAACVLAADRHWWWGVAAALGFWAAGCLWAGGRRRLVWLVCGGLAVGVFLWRDSGRTDAEADLAALADGSRSARVLRDARGSEESWEAPARLLDGSGAGTQVWWEGRGELPVAGAVVRATGNFGPLPEMRNPGEFDRGEWLRRQGVAAVFQTGWTEGTVETGALAALGARIRHGFRDAVTAGLEEDSQQAAVIRAVVIGEQPPDAEALISAFRNSGTLHAFRVLE